VEAVAPEEGAHVIQALGADEMSERLQLRKELLQSACVVSPAGEDRRIHDVEHELDGLLTVLARVVLLLVISSCGVVVHRIAPRISVAEDYPVASRSSNRAGNTGGNNESGGIKRTPEVDR